ncbi:MAG: hypothetical protein VYB44_08830 [Bacteroidota bacterium]|nr:hypothetical protein [Bacteroidota bacterium]
MQNTFHKIEKTILGHPFEEENIAVRQGLFNKVIYLIRRPILKRKYKKYRKYNADKPWMNPDAVKVLELLLNKESKVLEYGSGSSTKFFCARSKHVVSIEHNRAWFNTIKAQLLSEQINNVEYVLIEPDVPLPTTRLSSLDQINFSAEEYPIKDELFRTYSAYITRFKDEYFDMVVVDGRARATCAVNAISKIKEGGVLVLDNSERRRYDLVHETLKDWPKIQTTSGLTDTTFWLKPSTKRSNV